MAQYQTLVDLIERSITLHASRPALGTKRGDGFAFITYAELGERIARMRAGLAQASVGPGDRVALIADNREEWVVVAAATYGLGAQLVPMYQAQLPRDWAHILADSGAKVVFAANDAIAQKLKTERPQLPQLQHVFTLAGDGADSYTHLLTLGMRPVLSPTPSDVACFIYTSGTTGDRECAHLRGQPVLQRGAGRRGYERPRKCALLSEDFSCENGLLTPTLKLKRKAVVARYQDKLNELYAEARRADAPRAP
jgi:long-subunit acyl-CoA synthetase (AMP-forming)